LDQIVVILKDWPVLLQGAIGSGIFWLVLYLGPKIVEYFSLKISERSLKSRQQKLKYENIKYSMMIEEDIPTMGAYVGTLSHIAIRYIVKGLICLSLGLVTMSVIKVFGVVGFLGALYYFFKAADAVSPVDKSLDAEERQEEITSELSYIEQKLNKKINSDHK